MVPVAIDFLIEYGCYPKQTLTPEGVVDRVKGRQRAHAVIDLFRKSGDLRPVEEIGFEMARSTPDGTEETQVIMVKDLLDEAAALKPLEVYCPGCPANQTGQPFGCFDQIEYPISGKAEIWLLGQLPSTDETLIWLLLKQAVEEMKHDGTAVNPMRGHGQPYFQEQGVLARRLGEFTANTNMVFELLFLSGHLRPAYASVLLLLFKAIRRDLEADEVIRLSQSPEDAFEQYPFLLHAEPDDDDSITQFKAFFRSLYLAWGLNTRLLLDA